jgi:hypothetical protein
VSGKRRRGLEKRHKTCRLAFDFSNPHFQRFPVKTPAAQELFVGRYRF